MAEPDTTEEQVSQQEAANFTMWVCMLPFLVAIGYFCYQYLYHRDNVHWLLYAFGSLMIGLLFTAVVGGAINGDAATTDGAGER